MTLKELANDYQDTASMLKSRIDYLTELALTPNKTLQQLDECKNIDTRLALLQAQYYHLLKTSKYLRNYYINQPHPSLKTKEII